MTFIKKSIVAAVAAAVLSTAGAPLIATPSEATHYYGHVWKPKHHYKRHYRKRHCGWKRYKHWDGYQWIWYRKWHCR